MRNEELHCKEDTENESGVENASKQQNPMYPKSRNLHSVDNSLTCRRAQKRFRLGNNSNFKSRNLSLVASPALGSPWHIALFSDDLFRGSLERIETTDQYLGEQQ